MNVSAPSASEVAAASSQTILTVLPALFTHLIYTPAKVILLRAIPSALKYCYFTITYAVHYAVIALRFALIPVLYPLDLFIWRPSMAVLLLVYQYRYLIYFASSAVLLGTLLGLASFWLSSRLVGSNGKARSAVSERQQYISSIENDQKRHKSRKGVPPPVVTTSKSRSSSITPSKRSASSHINNRPRTIVDNGKSTSLNKNQTGIKVPKIRVLDEQAVLVKSPESEVEPDLSKIVSPAEQSIDDETADVEGRDRFSQAMKALAKQRKRSKYGSGVY